MSKEIETKMPVEQTQLVRRLYDSENRARELLRDREILHQDGERWREYGRQAISARNKATEALEAADECLEAYECVGHGLHMDAVTIARKLIREALDHSVPNA